MARIRDEVAEVCDGRVRLHIKIAGEGPPVVFFHPLTGLAWDPLTRWLADGHTVYAPEHPGTSPGDPHAIREVQTFWELLLLYEEALRRLGLNRPAAVGESFGGMIAADLAASFPDLFDKLILLSPLGLWHDNAPIRLAEVVTAPPDESSSYLFRYPESKAAQAMLALPDDPGEIPGAIAQSMWNVGCTTKFAWPIADHGLGRRLYRVSVPTLLLWGCDDALVPVAYAEEFGRRIVGSRVEVLDDCGHVLQADQPERTQALVTEFLDEQPVDARVDCVETRPGAR
jgi:pimeloyl-ACP methyl ester carboxylesterase